MSSFQTVLSCAAMALAAAAILVLRDRLRSKKLLKRLRERLRNREGCSDSELVLVFPLHREQEIAVAFRQRLSKALQIDAEKIHPDDDLHGDFRLNTIWPFLIGAIASQFTRDAGKKGIPQALSYRNDSTKFRDFVRAISQQSA